MPTVRDIATAIESFAPRELQESYDNTGLQIGSHDMNVTAALLCLDVTEDIIKEAKKRQCNMIISHHPLLFSGLKEITGETAIQRIVIDAVKSNIAIYAAHTNLDSAWNGVSHEIANSLDLKDIEVLQPRPKDEKSGLGVVGCIDPLPSLEFLRKVKKCFNVKSLRYSTQSSKLVIRRVAVCGGSGASLLKAAIEAKADVFVTGDIKYHDFTSYADDILIADIGHYESELCTKKIFSRIIREKFPNFVTYFAESEKNPINYM